MVDASIGGKTGVNRPLPPDHDGRSVLGKNLIGAFWQPRAVISDPAVLATLPARELRCGLAESIKHGMIENPTLLDFLDQNADAILARDPDVTTDFIARSAAVKIAIVQEDVRESGRRALLNLGHTFAHAFESIADLNLKHGEAVAVGLHAAAVCARACGLVDDALVNHSVALIERFNLPVRLDQPVPAELLLSIMAYDKKARGDHLRLILPVARGHAEIRTDVPNHAVTSALRAVGAG